MSRTGFVYISFALYQLYDFSCFREKNESLFTNHLLYRDVPVNNEPQIGLEMSVYGEAKNFSTTQWYCNHHSIITQWVWDNVSTNSLTSLTLYNTHYYVEYIIYILKNIFMRLWYNDMISFKLSHVPSLLTFKFMTYFFNCYIYVCIYIILHIIYTSNTYYICI